MDNSILCRECIALMLVPVGLLGTLSAREARR